MEITIWQWINTLVALASVIAAILAWVAKLKWSQEYTRAKDAVISEKEEQVKTKQSQIEFLERQIDFFKEQTPQKLREHYKSIQDQLGDIIHKQEQDTFALKKQLEEQITKAETSKEDQIKLQEDIKTKEIQIKKLFEELSAAKDLQDSAYRLEPSVNVEFNNRIEYLLDILNSSDDEEINEEEYYTPYPRKITVDSIAEWFFENYKDPVEGVPSDDGEYVYVYGGPYQANEELFEHFPDVDENVINAAVEKIEEDGTFDWVKRWQY